MTDSEDFPQVTAQADTIRDLCNTVQFIDALSQEAFSEIGSIAKLTKANIESRISQGENSLEDFYHTVSAIEARALNTLNLIKAEAEQAGCSYVGKLAEIKRQQTEASR